MFFSESFTPLGFGHIANLYMYTVCVWFI